MIVAHRGARVAEAENTLAAFRLALQQGADALETDLRFSADDQIILFHDSTLERMTNGAGLVRDQTLAELKRLRLRHPSGSLVDDQIPTLAELIAETHAQTPLLLELKDPLFLERGHAELLVQLLRDAGMVQRVALVSFHFDYVEAVKALAPEIPIGFITMWQPWPKRGSQLMGPLWPLLYLNPLYVWWAHRQGSIVAPLDPNPEPRLRTYLRRKVDALLADDPASVAAALDAALG